MTESGCRADFLKEAGMLYENMSSITVLLRICFIDKYPGLYYGLLRNFVNTVPSGQVTVETTQCSSYLCYVS